jgi:chorismate mutase/prephenate dehydratase
MAKKRTKASDGEGTRPASAAALQKLDRQIVELLNVRAQASGGEGLDETALNAAVEASAGPLPASAVKGVFRELSSGIVATRKQVRVAFLGPEYTYSHLAAISRFGESAELAPVASIRAVFEEVERGQAEFGVVPIENSTDGRVADSLDCLSRTSTKICGEAPLRIRHCLLGKGPRSGVRQVYSKSQPLSQCRNWLAAHLPGVRLVETPSTAEAANLAVAEHDAAAIASRQAGVHYGLSLLAEGIEDNPENVTRFAVIGRESGPRTGRDKTAIAFEAPHQPGALADAMAIFKRQRLNLTWIESFPVPQARGRYLFFVELQGHAIDLRVRRAIAALEKKALRLTVLGSFAESDMVE